METIDSLNDWFFERISGIRASTETKAYVADVFVKQLSSSRSIDVHDSVVIAYANAKESGDFRSFQSLGDRIVWVLSFCPDPCAAQRNLIESIGMSAYSTCNTIMMNRWPVFRELSRELPAIVFDLHRTVVAIKTAT